VPGLRLRSVRGHTITLPARRPQVLAFLDASACGPCRRTARALDAVKRELGSRLAAVIIDVDATDGRDAVSAFRRATGTAVPFVVDTRTNAIASRFGSTLVNGVVVARPGGRVVATLRAPSRAALRRAAIAAGAG
jgi:thiol-disulfide isomerase/thioredoxin